MPSILDKFSRPVAGFTPQSTQDIFALSLAQKLDDAAAIAHYVILVSQYSEGRVLNAYRRTLRNATDGRLDRRFQVEIQRAGENGSDLKCVKLLAVRVERRAIAAAVFYGHQLEYTQIRQLSSIKEKAVASAEGFINWLIETFPIESAAIEALPNAHEIQRKHLTEAITDVLRDRMLPIWQVSKEQLFEACGHPPLKSRKQLREVIGAIWPVLSGASAKVLIRDAAALGLYVQTERLFILN